MNIEEFTKHHQRKEPSFDWESYKREAIERLTRGESLEGKDGILAPLIQQLLQTTLEGELENHLRDERSLGKKNRKNGKGKKQVKTGYGMVEIETGRDRAGSFKPKILPKRQTTLGSSLDNKIISMYGRGMSYDDVRSHFEEMYGVELSKGHISHITDKVLPLLDSWRSRPLEEVYAITWLDALHFKVRKDGRIENRAVYCVLGVNAEGRKDLLGLYVSENEGAKFWLSVLTDLQNRGVQDILIACIDNLKGFAEAIESIFPKTEVQLCIVHQIRNSLRYVTSEDNRPFLKDLKKVYQAKTKDSAELNLDELEKIWGDKYPIVLRSWRYNWERLSQYFKYPYQIRRIIYTTNTVEGFNRQIRKITKSKGVLPNDRALLKLVYLITQNIMIKWTSPIPKWALTIQQLAIHFDGRIKIKLDTGPQKKEASNSAKASKEK